MTTAAWVAAAVAGIAALGDWWSVARNPPSRLQLVAKPATLLGLIGVALAVDPFDGGIRAVVVAALVWSLIGDVALMFERLPFASGLGAFLIAHVAYVVGFVTAGRTWWALVGGAAAIVGALVVGRRLISAVAARNEPGLRVGVALYMAAISAMVVGAFGVGHGLLVVAAALFYCSDAVLGWDRFVEPVRNARLIVHVTYHLAQAGFVAWLVVGSS